MDDEETLNATTFVLKNSVNEIVLDVLLDGEGLKWDHIKCEDETWKKGIELSDDAVLNAVFFEDFPPCVK